MIFQGWPDIHRECPVCGEGACATFRGYYQRLMFCPELEVPPGLIAIRTSFCRRRRLRFTLLPDFLIRYRRITRFTLQRLAEERVARMSHRLTDIIDSISGDLGEEFYLPLSSAYSYLKLPLPQPP